MTQVSASRQLTSQPTQGFIPWTTPDDPDMRDLMNDVVEPIKEPNPYLTWMTGKLPTSDRQMSVGWHVHRGVNPPLDDLLSRLGYKHHLIEHEGDGGEVELVDYWALNYRWDSAQGVRGDYIQVPCSLFVIARGVKDKREMNKDPKDRDGVAYGWECSRDKGNNIIYKENGTEKKTCRVKLRAYIHELLPAPQQDWENADGFTAWFQVSVSGFVCDDLLGALYSQYRAMRAYNQRLAASGNAGFKTPYWALSNPLVPSETTRRVTSKEDKGSTLIVPMRTLIPVREQDITDEYLHQHRMPEALQRELLDKEVLLEAWTWSVEESEYLEGVKPRPIGNPANAPFAASAVVVEEVPPPVAPSDLYIDEAQQHILLMLCNQDSGRVQALCQEYGIPDLAHLRISHFGELLLKLSQPRG